MKLRINSIRQAVGGQSGEIGIVHFTAMKDGQSVDYTINLLPAAPGSQIKPLAELTPEDVVGFLVEKLNTNDGTITIADLEKELDALIEAASIPVPQELKMPWVG